MNILFVSAAFYPTRNQGGRPMKARALARALVRAGHGVTVVAARQRDEESIETIATPWGRHFDDGGVDVHLIDSIHLYRIVTLNPRIGRFWRERAHSFDVVQIFGLYDFIGPAIARRCRRDGIPYTVEPCGMLTPRSRGLWMKRIFHRFVTRPLLRSAETIVVTSAGEHEEASSMWSDECAVELRPNGIDLEEAKAVRNADELRTRLLQRWQVSQDRPYFVFIGSLVHVKGLDLLLRAFRLATTNSSLLIIGPELEPRYADSLKELVSTSALGERVWFVGPLAGEEKRAVLGGGQLHILPSRNENFGNVVLEAAALGVPSLITEGCGVKDVASKFSHVVPCSVEGLTEGLRDLVDTSDLRSRLAEATVGEVEKLGWDAIVSKQVKVFESARDRFKEQAD